MRSEGTKETQGINGDATALQRRLAAVESITSSSLTYEPCGYLEHRPFHSAAPDGPLMCERCHPPAIANPERVRRGQPGFDELARAARERMTGRRPRCRCGLVLHGETELVRGTCTECARRKAAAEKAATAGAAA